MPWLPIVLTLAVTAASVSAPQKPGEPRRPTAPETFTANVQASGTAGAVAATITIKMTRYSAEEDLKAVEDALRQGTPAFLAALRKAPVVGTLTLGGQTFDIRWAREQRSAEHARTIVLVTDKPAYFIGSGVAAPKPREGYDVAVLKFGMDDSGVGYSGTMAAAARVKVGTSGIEVEDYGEKLIELRTISRGFN